jgi:hypothetical protein
LKSLRDKVVIFAKLSHGKDNNDGQDQPLRGAVAAEQKTVCEQKKNRLNQIPDEHEMFS